MNNRIGPDPDIVYPMKDNDKLVFLKNFVKASNIFVGDYTYFDDSRYGPDKFEEYNVLYRGVAHKSQNLPFKCAS